MIMNIFFSINRNYLLFCMVTIISIIKNNSNVQLNFHIVHENCITDSDIQNFLNKVSEFKKFNNFKIHLVDISKHPLFPKINKTIAHWTKEVNFKILSPSIFSNIDRILYLDCDVISKGNIQDIYNIDMDKYMFAGDKLSNDVCAGILLINLDMARKENFETTMLKTI